MNVKEIGIVVAVVAVIAVLLIAPFVTIWALNTLFPVLAIPYTLETWFAVVVLGGVFKTSVSLKK
jgi:hypothetical protein